MKRILLTAAAAMFLLIACNDKEGGGDSNASEARESHKNVLNGIETGDAAKLKAEIATDAIDHGGNVDGSDIVGADSIVAMLSKVKNGFSDLKFEIVNSASEGDIFFATVRMVGTTNNTPVWGLQPNQKIDATSVDVIKMKDGKALEHWSFLSQKDVMAMMQGMHQQPPPVKDTVKTN